MQLIVVATIVAMVTLVVRQSTDVPGVHTSRPTPELTSVAAMRMRSASGFTTDGTYAVGTSRLEVVEAAAAGEPGGVCCPSLFGIRLGAVREWEERALNRIEREACEWAYSEKGYWRISNSPILSRALPDAYWADLGLKGFADPHRRFRGCDANRRMLTRTSGGVGGAGVSPAPTRSTRGPRLAAHASTGARFFSAIASQPTAWAFQSVSV